MPRTLLGHGGSILVRNSEQASMCRWAFVDVFVGWIISL